VLPHALYVFLFQIGLRVRQAILDPGGQRLICAHKAPHPLDTDLQHVAPESIKPGDSTADGRVRG
jgi:hypothetical protein